MGIIVKHVLKHASGRCSYRRTYPPELRSFIGPRELKIPLGTEGSPGFHTRLEEARRRYDDIVGRARRQRDGAFDRLDTPRIAFLAETFRIERLEGDDQARWSPDERELYRSVGATLAEQGVRVQTPWAGAEGRRWALKRRETLEWTLPRYRQMKADGDLEAIVETWRDEAEELIAAQGLVVDLTAHGDFALLCRAMNDAAIAAGQDMLRRLEGEEVPTPPAIEPPVAATFVDQSMEGVPLLATFDAYAVAAEMSAGVREEWRTCIQHLIDHLGHHDAARITAQDLREWREKLLTEPTRRGTRRSPRTVRGRYISAVKATLNWAVEEGKLATNVAREVTVRVPKKHKLREPNFTSDEARAILAATVEPAPAKVTPGYARARRWVPWLCAYSGARVNEFSQLRGEDVQKVDGIWAIRITPEAGTVKTKEARLVPLHQHLIDQGFLKIVEANGPGPLFYEPSRQRVEKDSNRHIKKVGEHLARWVRRDVGITDPTIQPNHAWRHLFKTMSYAAGIEERLADAIQGHAPRTTGRSYGGARLPEMAEAINKLPRFEASGDERQGMQSGSH